MFSNALVFSLGAVELSACNILPLEFVAEKISRLLSTTISLTFRRDRDRDNIASQTLCAASALDSAIGASHLTTRIVFGSIFLSASGAMQFQSCSEA